MNAFIIEVFLLSAYFSLSSQLDIKYIALVFRHGDRTPIAPYPTDPWQNESLWPVPFGELTNIGKQQHYQLGSWIRDRYYNFLPMQYDPREVYVKSTDVDRTIMSAQANLAGMFPPVAKSVWNNNLMWQPIPVHTIPSSEDNILAMRKNCPAYNEELFHITHSVEYQKRLSKYKELMQNLSCYTGKTIKNYKDIEYVYSNLKIEKLYNLTLPKWARSIFPNKLEEPACYSFVIPTSTATLARLKVGPFLNEIIANMKNVSGMNKHPLKMSMYSAHDDTVADILNALNLFDGNCPVYTSTIFIELLHENKTDQKFIRILYRNFTTIDKPYVLSIPHCIEPCPLDRFISLYKNLLPVDWETECRSHALDNLYAQLFLSIIILVVFFGSSLYRRIKMYQAPVKI